VPFAGKVQAGKFVEIDIYDQSIEYGDHPATPLPDPRFPKARQFSWQVVGDSMDRDNILDGMMVLGADYHDYSETYSEVKDGDLVIIERARNDGQEIERTVKRIRFFMDRFELHPNSSNPDHKPISVSREQKTDNGEEVRLLAVVLSAHTILLG
jgi:SOS-response transcriptional repressor LexA